MKVFFLALFLICASLAEAQNASAGKDTAYAKIAEGRAAKIVSSLHLSDAAKAARVTALVSGEYVALNAIYAERDEKMKAAKAAVTDKQELAAKTKEAEDAIAPRIRQTHDAFIQKLSAELAPEQITQIKDGLTYNVLPITYKAFLEMIPSLKPAEKEQIMAWLVEAREHAMDAESSEKKHGWFGKYKGKINNYLAARGYDLQKERAAWQERIKAKEEEKKSAHSNQS